MAQSSRGAMKTGKLSHRELTRTRRYEKAIEGKASPRHTGSRAGREQWLCIVNLRCRRTARMGGGSHDLYYLHRPRRTRALRLSMRLRPVHRRGGPEEVRHRRRRDRGVDPGLREPQGGLRERPDWLRPVPRAARAGRRLRRGRRLEDAEAVGREEAQERQARRRLPGAPARHAEHHRGVGASRRGGGRPRPVAR